ncbi:MAG: diguanylate cyclase [Halomonas sp.]|nr:diguanylate cyclase [Halomonas sp.]TVP44412.1 MAG: diguanylate cyclase [Halomonas sp.]
MANPEQTLLESKLAALKQSYLATLESELLALYNDLSEAIAHNQEEPAALAHTLEDIHRRLHKIAGSAGTFGFQAVGQQVRTLEVTLQSWLEASHVLPPFTKLSAFVQQLWELQREVSPGALPQAHTLAEESAITSVTIIWLVEEDVELGNRILEQLNNFSYTVRLFTTVKDANHAASKEIPDVVIIDAGMEFANLSVACPLLFISDQDTFEARVRAAQLNAHGYFLKPLNIPQLVNRLEQLLHDREAPPARILIVDDDYQLAMYYQLVLEAAGMEVRILEQPEHIIEQMSVFRPELLLMDVHMPAYNGPDLAAVVRQYEEWGSLPIVFLSAETDLNKQIDALSHGADDFLTKPISAAQLVASVRARVARARTLSALLNKDSLTGLLKHASIKSATINEVARAYRQNYPVIVAMMDIDNFKTVNDTHGHAVGDVVIASVATLLRQRLRQTDLIGRYGGEEFLMVLPHCGAQDGWKRLENIREYFSRLRFRQGDIEFSCTLSAGMICSTDVSEEKRENLLVAADEALYRAKRGGRNKVCY